VGPSVGVGAGGEGQRIYVFFFFFESLRMALVITLHHKYSQLSGSNHALPIHSRIGVVIMLVLCLSIILEIYMCIFASCQCTDYAHASYAGAGEVLWHVFHLLFGVRYQSRPRRRPRPPSPSPKNAVVPIYLSQAYLNVSDCVIMTRIWPIRTYGM